MSLHRDWNSNRLDETMYNHTFIAIRMGNSQTMHMQQLFRKMVRIAKQNTIQHCMAVWTIPKNCFFYILPYEYRTIRRKIMINMEKKHTHPYHKICRPLATQNDNARKLLIFHIKKSQLSTTKASNARGGRGLYRVLYESFLFYLNQTMEHWIGNKIRGDSPPSRERRARCGIDAERCGRNATALPSAPRTNIRR